MDLFDDAEKIAYDGHALSADYLPGEAVCPGSFLTFNKHLKCSPYAEWDEKRQEWHQTW